MKSSCEACWAVLGFVCLLGFQAALSVRPILAPGRTIGNADEFKKATQVLIEAVNEERENWSVAFKELLENFQEPSEHPLIDAAVESYIDDIRPGKDQEGFDVQAYMRSFFDVLKANYAKFSSFAAFKKNLEMLSNNLVTARNRGELIYIWLPNVPGKSQFWVTALFCKVIRENYPSFMPNGIALGYSDDGSKTLKVHPSLNTQGSLIQTNSAHLLRRWFSRSTFIQATAGTKPSVSLFMLDDMAYSGRQMAKYLLPELCRQVEQNIAPFVASLSVYAQPIYVTGPAEVLLKKTMEDCAVKGGIVSSYKVQPAAVIQVYSNPALHVIRQEACKWALPGTREFFGISWCRGGGAALPPVYFDHKTASLTSTFAEVISVGYLPGRLSRDGQSSFRHLLGSCPWTLQELYGEPQDGLVQSQTEIELGISAGQVTVDAKAQEPEPYSDFPTPVLKARFHSVRQTTSCLIDGFSKGDGYSNGDIGGAVEGVVNARSCQYLCEEHPECGVFLYESASKKCWKKCPVGINCASSINGATSRTDLAEGFTVGLDTCNLWGHTDISNFVFHKPFEMHVLLAEVRYPTCPWPPYKKPKKLEGDASGSHDVLKLQPTKDGLRFLSLVKGYRLLVERPAADLVETLPGNVEAETSNNWKNVYKLRVDDGQEDKDLSISVLVLKVFSEQRVRAYKELLEGSDAFIHRVQLSVCVDDDAGIQGLWKIDADKTWTERQSAQAKIDPLSGQRFDSFEKFKAWNKGRGVHDEIAIQRNWDLAQVPMAIEKQKKSQCDSINCNFEDKFEQYFVAMERQNEGLHHRFTIVLTRGTKHDIQLACGEAQRASDGRGMFMQPSGWCKCLVFKETVAEAYTTVVDWVILNQVSPSSDAIMGLSHRCSTPVIVFTQVPMPGPEMARAITDSGFFTDGKCGHWGVSDKQRVDERRVNEEERLAEEEPDLGV